MYSTFLVLKNQCLVCNNQVLKELGKLQGVFGAELERIEGIIVVSHTDEVNRKDISKALEKLGFPERNAEPETDSNNPSIWGCSL